MNELAGMVALDRNIKIWLAFVALVGAIVVLIADKTIVQGTGLIVATLAAGGCRLLEFRDDRGECGDSRGLPQ
jgi:hypothetical protein